MNQKIYWNNLFKMNYILQNEDIKKYFLCKYINKQIFISGLLKSKSLKILML